jgi:uncharacterized protein (TIGR03083 family)
MPLPPSLSVDQCTTTIAAHSAALADAADGNLDAAVEYCPGWTVRDLLHHITEVHWFWATIVEERITERPDHLEHPERAGDDDIVARFRAAAQHLVEVLSTADPDTHVWTWAVRQQDVAFVVRHQVQETLVHHWDAAHAAGGSVAVDPAVAADSVDEMLEFSVLNAGNYVSPEDDPLPPALDGTFALRCTDSDSAWVVTDGDVPGLTAVTATTASDVAAQGLRAVTGTGGQLLLWLYDRHGDPAGDADTTAVDAADPELLTRFRPLCFTD